MHLLTNQNLLEKTDWIFVFQIFGYPVHRFHPLCYFQYFFSQIDMNESKRTITIWVLLLVRTRFSRIRLIWCDSQQLENPVTVRHINGPAMILTFGIRSLLNLPSILLCSFQNNISFEKSAGNINKINFWKHNWMIAQLKWKTKKCSFWKNSSFFIRQFSEYNHLSWLCRLL